MQFDFKLREEKIHITLHIPILIGKIRVYANEKELKQLNEKGKPYEIKLSDGSVRKMYLKSVFYDYIPKVEINEEEILLARKLFWYEYVLSCLPLVLLAGGALGGVLGVIGVFSNMRIFRSEFPIVFKIMSGFAVFIISFLLYIAGVIVLKILIGRL